MKIKSIFSLALAIIMLSACNDKEADIDVSPIVDGTVAFLSVNIATQATTRTSSENNGTAAESDLKTLYLITFDDQGNVLQAPGAGGLCFVKINNVPSDNKPEPQKVSAKSEKLLVIANPGPQMLIMLQGLTTASTYTTLNNAISSVAVSEINHPDGFTMINSGTETSSMTAGSVISDPLIDLLYNGGSDSYVKEVTTTEAAAIAAADGDRVDVKIERLASKVELNISSGLTASSSLGTASFDFKEWVLDGLNSTFFPFAEKTILDNTNHTSVFYTSPFYTEDPNYELADASTGIDYATINSSTYAPEFPQGFDWKTTTGSTAPNYCIENTMEKDAQKFKNATRLVIKATYFPDEDWAIAGDDWFSWAGVYYKNLGELQDAYDAAGAASHLKDACDDMLDKINTFRGGAPIADFMDLTTTILSSIPNGGEVIKDGKNSVINWYQEGRNYYYYEIRHDNDTDIIMDFAKYGVVRNNWYALTLNSVSGPGTPWYPDINNPGPGDPDPDDNIDEAFGYLGITVEVAPWIYWQTGFDL